MSSASLQQLKERLCYKVTKLVRKIRQRKSWNGPTCTCKAFRDRGKCRHLELFKESTIVETDVKKQKKSRFSFQSSDEDPSSSSATTTSTTTYTIAASKYAISNEREGGNIGEAIVPKSIKPFTARIDLLDNLGRGGCGRLIYRSASDEHGVVLAKVLRCEAPSCLPHHQYVLNSELSILAKLKPHANIVSFFGYSEVLVEGAVLERRVAFEFAVDTLGDLVQHRSTAHRRLTFLEIRNYCLDILSALEYLHSSGIVHRDVNAENVIMTIKPYPSSGQWSEAMKRHFRLSLSMKSLFQGSSTQDVSRTGPKKSSRSIGWRSKPNNHHAFQLSPQVFGQSEEDVSLGPTMVAKLGNFEVAKEIHTERTRTRVSSPVCMAPEMWLSDSYDYAVDVWAFGTIMYEMLAKEKPMAKMTLSQIESTVTAKSFPPRGNVAPSEYKPIESIMRKCLAHSPSQRPTVPELVKELKNALI